MKFVRTVVIFDQGELIEGPQWGAMHEAVVLAIDAIVNPLGSDKFMI